MTYIKNSMTFREALTHKIPEEQKKKAIQDIFEALKTLHNYDITLGDIHLDNFLINQTGGTLIDLDYMRFKGDEFKFQACYDVTFGHKKYTSSSKYSDSIKTAIVSISLLIGIDLEEELLKYSSINLDDLETYLINYPELQKFIKEIKTKEEPFYLDDYLKEKSKDK